MYETMKVHWFYDQYLIIISAQSILYVVSLKETHRLINLFIKINEWRIYQSYSSYSQHLNKKDMNNIVMNFLIKTLIISKSS
jgi:hypothetical protein